jgi:hypothetical protein
MVLVHSIDIQLDTAAEVVVILALIAMSNCHATYAVTHSVLVAICTDFNLLYAPVHSYAKNFTAFAFLRLVTEQKLLQMSSQAVL